MPDQVRMLRVIQEKVIERVGGSKLIPVDIRIIAATHRNLDEMVSSGKFRQDLFFRINVFPIYIPPLRERKEDIPTLVFYFMEKKAKELKLPVLPELADGAKTRLLEYDWPGNVRELENVIEHEMILNRKGPLTFNNLSGDEGRKVASISDLSVKPITFDEMSVHHVTRVLREAKGKVEGANGAAEMLGVNPSTLRSRMKKLGIQYGRKYRN